MSSRVSRPKRLWAAAIMNIFVGLLSLAALLFVLISPQAPAELRPGFARALTAGGIAMFLVVASIAALMGRQQARLGMLGAALVFFGTLAIQNILLIAELSGTGDPKMFQKLGSNVVRSTIEIAINAWALLSAKTVAFFSSRQSAP